MHSGCAQRCTHACSKGTASDLYKDAVDEVAKFFGDFPTDSAATIKTPCILSALYAEWNCTRNNSFAKPQNARVAGRI
jgi:hypothetical protein